MTVGDRDTSEVAHQDVLHFFYDAQSRPAKADFNGDIIISCTTCRAA